MTDIERIDGTLVESEPITGTLIENELIAGTISESVGAGGLAGWIKIADVTPRSGGTVSAKVYRDPGPNTVLESATSSDGLIDVLVLASFPIVTVGGVGATLTEAVDAGHYSGTVAVTQAASGVLSAIVTDPNGQPGFTDNATITIDPPPTITSALFSGGYPGAQTAVKEDDNFNLDVVADKSFDRVVISDFGAGQSENIDVPPGTSASVALMVARRGTSPTLLGARIQVRDNVTGALSATFDTDSAGSVDGTNVLNLTDLHPTHDGFTKTGAGAPTTDTGHAFGPTYPGGQSALKDAESATVPGASSDFDVIAYDDPTSSELTITLPAVAENPKTVTRAGGTYNVTTDNYRVTLTRNENGAQIVVSGVIQIADATAVLTVTHPGARIRSGVAPGEDTTITMSFNQKMQATPTMSPAASRGTFTGAFVDSGDQEDWTATLRVPDADNPTDGSSNAWVTPSGTNLAGRVTSVTASTYVVGGFARRTLTYPPATANSTESFPVTTEANLSIGRFSNGNDGVVQPFGTADTSDVGKEGWWAPNAASGSTTGRMLHIPTVAANGAGLTLPDVEETA